LRLEDGSWPHKNEPNISAKPKAFARIERMVNSMTENPMASIVKSGLFSLPSNRKRKIVMQEIPMFEPELVLV